jgi:hypothetical protein
MIQTLNQLETRKPRWKKAHEPPHGKRGKEASRETAFFGLNKKLKKDFGRAVDRKNQITGFGNYNFSGSRKHHQIGKAKTAGISGCFNKAEVTRRISILIKRRGLFDLYLSFGRIGRFLIKRLVIKNNPSL